jgi:hypothetical protein
MAALSTKNDVTGRRLVISIYSWDIYGSNQWSFRLRFMNVRLTAWSSYGLISYMTVPVNVSLAQSEHVYRYNDKLFYVIQYVFNYYLFLFRLWAGCSATGNSSISRKSTYKETNLIWLFHENIAPQQIWHMTTQRSILYCNVMQSLFF